MFKDEFFFNIENLMNSSNLEVFVPQKTRQIEGRSARLRNFG